MEARPTPDTGAVDDPSRQGPDTDRDLDPQGPSWRRIGRAWLHVAAFLLALGLVIGPTLMAAAVNDRLHDACPSAATEGGGWTYDRDSWLPLLWSCEVSHRSGDVETIHVWNTFG